MSTDVHRCRVCGLYNEEPPWGPDGSSPLYVFCPCCGVESGYGDCSLIGARNHRERWIARGAPWFEPKEKPASWDLAEQLEHVPEDFR